MNILLAPATYKGVTIAAGGDNVLRRRQERCGQCVSLSLGGVVYKSRRGSVERRLLIRGGNPEAEAGSVYVDVQGDRIAVTTCCWRSVGVVDVEDLWQGEVLSSSDQGLRAVYVEVAVKGRCCPSATRDPDGTVSVTNCSRGKFSPLFTGK